MSSRTGSLGVATAKGDLYTIDATGKLVRVPVGADGKVLVADSANPLGMAWKGSAIQQVYKGIESNAGVPGFLARGRNIATAGSFFVGDPVPPDFGTLVSLFAWIVPSATEAARSFTMNTNFGAPNAAVAASTGGQTIVRDVTIGTHVFLEFTTASPGLAALDGLGIQLINVNAAQISMLGFGIRYLRA
jgi:hypothetical protein